MSFEQAEKNSIYAKKYKKGQTHYITFQTFISYSAEGKWER